MSSPSHTRGRLAALLAVGGLAAGLALAPSIGQAYDLPRSTTTDARVTDLETAVKDVHRRLCVKYPTDSECTPPDTTITAAPASPTNSAAASVSFTADKTGSRFECKLDTDAFAACATPQTYSGLADGAHTVQVRAIDTYANIDTTPATRTWTVDATAPDTTITAAPADGTATSASFSYTSTETGSTFQCKLDAATYATCTSPTTYTGLAVGSHTFTVQATDAVGNTDQTPATHTWTITAPPPPAATKPRMGGTVSANSDWAAWETAMGPSALRRTYGGNIASTTTFANSQPGTAGDYAAGRESVFSFKPTTMSTFGTTDTTAQNNLLAYLRSVPVGHKLAIICWHEPEDNIVAGSFTVTQWKACVTKTGELVDQVNTEKGANSKLRNAIALMGPWTFDTRSAYSTMGFDTWTSTQLALIDAVGIDPYFWNPGDPSMEQMLTHDDSGTLTTTSRSTMTKLGALNKPVLFTEWGTTRTGRTDSQRATDITSTYNWAKTWNGDGNPATPQIESLIYFHLDPGTNGTPPRDLWKVIGYPLAEAALRNAMADSRTP